MADYDTERRLIAMGIWYHTRESGGHFAFTSAYEEFLGNGYRESSVPLLINECWETHNAVLKLPKVYREAIYAHYLREGPKGERLGNLNQGQIAERHLKVSERTYERRLEEGRMMVRIEIRLAKDVANRPYLTAINH